MPDRKISVLVVDDSVVYRSQLKTILSTFECVGSVVSAANGKIALEKMQLSQFDLVILDLEMPVLDGLSTLKQMKVLGLKSYVVVFSSYSIRGAEITMDALREGAVDFIPKPASSNSSQVGAVEYVRQNLERQINYLGLKDQKTKTQVQTPRTVPIVKKNIDNIVPKIILIGSSTGGPNTLAAIFEKMATPFPCPVVIVQHMPPLFTASLAARLAKASGLEVKEASHGEILDKKIYIAPGDFHLRLKKEEKNVVLQLDQSEKINSVRPAVDPLFESAAKIYGHTCLGIVLTGMGKDGRDGAVSVKENGGAVIIQERQSCVVYGMPFSVEEAGAFDSVLTPAQLSDYFNKLANTLGVA